MILKNDGQYSFYIIEEWSPNNTWETPNYHKLGYPYDFNLTNKCATLTGIPGTFSVISAYQGIKKLRTKYPEKVFRLLFVEISQQTSVL